MLSLGWNVITIEALPFNAACIKSGVDANVGFAARSTLFNVAIADAPGQIMCAIQVRSARWPLAGWPLAATDTLLAVEHSVQRHFGSRG